MKTQLVILISIFGLTGCGGSSGGGETPPPMNELTDITSRTVNEEPKEIDDAIMLKTDINSLFIGSEPIEIESGDTVLDVIYSLGGS